MQTSSAQVSAVAVDREGAEALFLEQLTTITGILNALARRHRLSTHDAEDFRSWAILRLMDNDYAILRKFRGESAFGTYLSVVLATMLREYRVAEWGRWRSSAAARREGEVAVRLEMLLERDGLTLRHACELLRTSGVTTVSDGALAQIASRLPRRNRLRPAYESEQLIDVPSPDRSDELVEHAGREADLCKVHEALQSALDALEADERLIVSMRFSDSMSIADIARGLVIPQKPLYRRLSRSLAIMRERMEEIGVSEEHVRTFVG